MPGVPAKYKRGEIQVFNGLEWVPSSSLGLFQTFINRLIIAPVVNFVLTWSLGTQTADRTLSLPTLTGNATLALLEETQTHSGAKTFSARLTASAGVNITGSVAAFVPNSIAADFASYGRIFAVGPDASTRGTLLIRTIRSDGSGDQNAMSFWPSGGNFAGLSPFDPGAGNFGVGGNLSVATGAAPSATAAITLPTASTGGILFGDIPFARSSSGNLCAGGINTVTAFTVDGNASGTAGGGNIGIRNNGSSVVFLGNYSSIHGGAYDGSGTIWSNTELLIGASANLKVIRLDISGNVNFNGATPAARTTLNAAIAAPSAAYVQAEATAMRDQINLVRTALQSLGLAL